MVCGRACPNGFPTSTTSERVTVLPVDQSGRAFRAFDESRRAEAAA